jgi:HD superfamily phosphohydrolase/serine/threonine protein kinase
MKTEDNDKLLQDVRSYKKSNFDGNVEAEHLANLLADGDITRILNGYNYDSILGIGGSGIVVGIVDEVTKSKRALKLSRRSAAVADEDPENPVVVDLEIESLALVNHQNITRFYGGHITEENHYCIITEIVENPKELDVWLQDKLDKTKPVAQVLHELARVLLGPARALSYMHNRLELYHMDVKPGNILVDGRGDGYVTDLGFARPKKKFKTNEMVPIGFTFGFHHPKLEEHGKFRQPSTKAKARNKLLASDLSPVYDIYAFGRTLLFLLKLVTKTYGEKAQSDYSFQYLHLLASLMLDGKNVETVVTPLNELVFESETACGIRGNLLQEFKFESFYKIEERLNRLLGNVSIQAAVPELNEWNERHINHGLGYLTMTDRTASLINHPTFRRLKSVSQLGMVEEVYPSATHTRFAHTLGVVGLTSRIICSLYHDPENPIMRVLLEKEDIQSLIVAAFVHDLGQSDLGHELEELDAKIFSHSEIGMKILKDKLIVDKKGRSLSEIIEGTAEDEWDVSVNRIGAILNDSKDTRFSIFTDILDGPIDADKLDYLLRDGHGANVEYPSGLDLHRFIHSITALPVKVSVKPIGMKLRLGVKEKGMASTEAISFARRQMYRAVYLHHTVRSLKAMVLSSCAASLTAMKIVVQRALGDSVFDSPVIAELFCAHLLAREPQRDSSWSEKAFPKILKISKQIQKSAEEMYSAGLELNRATSFFWHFMPEPSRMLFREYSSRVPYKRLAARSIASFTDSNLEKVREVFSWNRRQDVTKEIEEKLLASVGKLLENKQQGFESLNVDPKEPLKEFNEKRGRLILLDMPLRTLGAGGRVPPVLTDLARKSGDFESPESGSGIGWIWREGADQMMKEVLTCWVFCEPQFHHVVTTLLDQSSISKILDECIKGWSLE